MDIDTLKIAALVARRGSFAAAARVMGRGSSSVFRAVASAEAELGFRLFQGTTRTLSPTEEDEIFLARVFPLLDEFQEAREMAAAIRTAPKVTL